MESKSNSEADVESAKSVIYELITREQIDEILTRIRDDFDVDLNGLQVNRTKPGDDLFDQKEIQHKLGMKYGSFEKVEEIIKSHGYDPENLPIDNLKDVAIKESIILQGKLPGFILTSGNDEIVCFSVKDENAIELATKYAEKEGESEKSFKTTAEAVDYLKHLAPKAFYHEIAHIIYSQGNFSDWDAYIEGKPEIQNRVIELQRDKYIKDEDIPVAEEAFGDFAVDVLSNGKFVCRLGKNDEATGKIRSLIKRIAIDFSQVK